MEQIRVLHCNNDNKNMGGAYLVTRKLDSYMRDYGYVFDYITMDEFVNTGNDKVDPAIDSRLYSARLRDKKVIGHIKLPFFVNNILKKNSYKIVHIDIDSAWKALLYAIPAKRSGARVLIHSHAAGIDGSHQGLKGMLHGITKQMLSKYADKYIGCSQRAVKWLCPENRREKSEVLINGIDSREFFFDEELRNNARRELGVEDRFVLCNVARINDNKNQVFLVDVLKEIRKTTLEATLLLVGPYTEEDYRNLINKVTAEGINDSVIIIGETTQVNKYLNAADFFVLTSILEGLSLASIEAQATGIRCLLSTGTPPEAIIGELAVRMDLAEGASAWAELIQKEMAKYYDRNNTMIGSQYTMTGMAEHLSLIYKEINA